jgi:hypothetical protein
MIYFWNDNLFVETGHLHYTKSIRYYLQQKLELPNTHPSRNLLKFHTKQLSYHTITRTDRYCAGLWSDLIIEPGICNTYPWLNK